MDILIISSPELQGGKSKGFFICEISQRRIRRAKRRSRKSSERTKSYRVENPYPFRPKRSVAEKSPVKRKTWDLSAHCVRSRWNIFHINDKEKRRQPISTEAKRSGEISSKVQDLRSLRSLCSVKMEYISH